MPYDEELDARIADFALPLGAVRKPMFGGTGYMVNGNLMAGVWHERLVLRVGPEAGDAALRQPHVEAFAPVKGRPMAGWILVGPEALGGGRLEDWLALASEYVSTLPPK